MTVALTQLRKAACVYRIFSPNIMRICIHNYGFKFLCRCLFFSNRPYPSKYRRPFSTTMKPLIQQNMQCAVTLTKCFQRKQKIPPQHPMSLFTSSGELRFQFSSETITSSTHIVTLLVQQFSPFQRQQQKRKMENVIYILKALQLWNDVCS